MSKFNQIIREEQIRAKQASEIENEKLAEKKRKEQELEELKARFTSKIKEYLVELNELFPRIKVWEEAFYYTDFLKIKRNTRYLKLNGAGVVTERGDYYQWVNKGLLTGAIDIDKVAESIFVCFRYDHSDEALINSDVEALVRDFFAKVLEGKV